MLWATPKGINQVFRSYVACELVVTRETRTALYTQQLPFKIDLMEPALNPINAVTAAHHVIRNVNILREHALQKKQTLSNNTVTSVTHR
jgi:hypothetical protein